MTPSRTRRARFVSRREQRRFAQLRLSSLESRCVPASLQVTVAGDSGAAGQLRAIWETARTNGTDDDITFAAGVTSITLTSPLNTYGENAKLTITGNGKGTTFIVAPPSSRIFDFNAGAGSPAIKITDLALKGGNITSGYGGAIRNDNEVLTLTNVAFQNNTAVSGGGALSITSSGSSLTITTCDFTGNVATTTSVSSITGGGAIYVGAATTVTINTSVFDANNAVSGSSLFATSTMSFSSDSCTFKNGVSTGASSFSGGALFFRAAQRPRRSITRR